MNKPKLSPEQQRVVEHCDGPLLLVASAGSGKTRVLTERIHSLLENKTGHYHILALTFTNKAADEMRGRLDIDEPEDGVSIGNIHKFCMKILCDRGSVIGFNREPQIFDRFEDRLEILFQAFESDPRLLQYLKANSDKKYFLKQVLENISNEKKSLRPPHYDAALETMEEKKLFAYVYGKYNELLINQNALDFDDILMFTYQIFNEFPRITAFYRRLYRYICIDEAQDLNFAQYHVIKSLCGNEMRNLMLVGDPKQAIYGFNGASCEFMTKHFIHDFEVPKENQFELTQNYRSSKRIIAAANLLQPSLMTEIQAIDGEVQALSFPDENAEADWVVNKIQTLKQTGHPDIEGDITWERCAILGRTRYVMQKLEEKLKQHNIPYYYKRTQDFIESESRFIRGFELGMHLLRNPQNRLHFQKLLELLNLESFRDEMDKQNWQNGFDMLSWTNHHLNTDFAPHLEILLTAWQSLVGEQIKFREVREMLEKYAQQTWADEELAMVYNDLKMWSEHWQSYVRQTDREQRNLADFLNHVALGATHQQHHGLALLTVHTAKGLEFDVVCIMGMSEGIFPYYLAVKEGGFVMEEEKHNVYVALTRSKRLAYFTYPRNKLMPWGESKQQQPSRYLNQMGLILAQS
jgi:DNA helicase II / ATP-dependent DNA helicase PcrA